MDDSLHQLQNQLDAISDRLDAPVDKQKPKPGELPKLLRQIYRLRYNLLTNRIETNGEPINGNFLKTLWVELEEKHQIVTTQQAADCAAVLAADQDSYHPVREYLNDLDDPLPQEQWDNLGQHVFALDPGDKQSTLFLQRQLIACVARAMKPGAKVDTCLVIYSSKQGIGKSDMWSILGGPWFSDSLGDLRNVKEDKLQAHSAWIHEWGEIDRVMGKRESETLKSFLSATKDDIRKPYGRGVETMQRAFVIVGTTNRMDFIKDQTGNRRFPIISTKSVNIEWIREHRDAIWCRARESFRNGAVWYYTNDENRLISRIAESYSAEDPLRDAIESWMEDHPGQREVTTPELLSWINPDKLGDKTFANQAGRILVQLGWERTKERVRRTLRDGTKHDRATLYRR